ncbi:(deoxy)nucleoside triphosphate pyrophosphohydrolase [Bartonella krasnovii]|uniref:8-oxo-dGTP diphosphatase n=1 Tax=Bartonella krasnovii TaxID=2267275 RepID=A0ABY3VY34_9HYPH|nr:(deoxy)nucleoside triphosphate pyrophosphohydrolase [Bartonella krasnovii]UNF29291.1 (deoxy)nucleoside triphosphate pyrophosphohydrolase [Bartonella krasnovii]UNF35648.1 (deoxy)nucleoside triphosphate pyrophosphohydrolase [Bartonella krasnovii]UNF44010.1 (deoxy)nucleoside triphosphate pyrophosphohydrolase [Bartonella krasnovii]UNF47198.1 (deoxy)nucleoside triphosphate pyrophosphohydrolase [Bartonella krasnovii]UNF48834.1 (deoxy)nucleoside triphosphate pyrophosphohydrolase [Bartonella krasno
MGTKSSLLLVVACALLDQDNRVLLTKRPQGKSLAGLWEFPGGKVEQGEIPEISLIRELEEELGIHVQVDNLQPLTFASHSYETFHLLMPLYLCRHYEGVARGREGQNLKWVFIGDLERYPMPDADKPLVQILKNYLL